jgi:hypothetical protein
MKSGARERRLLILHRDILVRFQSQEADRQVLAHVAASGLFRRAFGVSGLFESPGTPHPGLFYLRYPLRPWLDKWKCLDTGRAACVIGSPRRLCGMYAAGDQLSYRRRAPTTLGCSVKYERVVGKLYGRQCPGVHHYVVRINPLT